MSRRKRRPAVVSDTNGFVPLVCTGKNSHTAHFFGPHFRATSDGVELWIVNSGRVGAGFDLNPINARKPTLRMVNGRINAHRASFEPVDGDYDHFTDSERSTALHYSCPVCDLNFQRRQSALYRSVEALLSNGVSQLDISWING